MRFLQLCPGLIFTLLGALAGCSSQPNWPAPKRTGEIRLRDDRREPIATVTLGDALHIVLPPPLHPHTEWAILLLNTHILRQMTAIKPTADAPPGSEEVMFQAIKVTGRTSIRFAAINASDSTQSTDDVFTVNIGIPHPASLFPTK